MIAILAPAKINLTLEVLGKRADGYHEIRSVVQTVSLCDVFSFDIADSIECKSDSTDWVAEKSLVSRAAMLLKTTGHYSGGAIIGVKKQIPLLAGLGGDSSGAAATLHGLNKLWKLGLSREDLLPLAHQLGSDVAFFLYGGTALVEGRGEIVTPLPSLPHCWVVIAVPPVPRQPGKTRHLYESLKPGHYTSGQITQRLVEEVRISKEFSASLLFNTFENVAFTHFSGLDASRRHMAKVGATNVHLAGSGPALFTMIEDKAQAEDLCSRLEKQGLEPYLTETLLAQEQI